MMMMIMMMVIHSFLNHESVFFSISLIVVITYMKNYSSPNSTSYPKYILSGIFIYRLVNSLLTILFIAIVIIFLIRDSFDRVPPEAAVNQ